MSEESEVTNWYERVPKKFKQEEFTYPAYEKLKIKLPFHAIVVGMTGSGKTNAVIELFDKIGAFTKVILLTKMVEEELYQAFIHSLREVEKKTGEKVLDVYNEVTQLPKVTTFPDKPKEATLLIVDDMMTEKESDLKTVVEYWTMGRKKQVSCIFISQSYYATPPNIRKNSKIVILTMIQGERDLQMILSESKGIVTEDQLKAMYEQATKGGFPNFFLIDKSNPDEAYKFRRNFRPLSVPAKLDIEATSKPGKGTKKKRGRVTIQNQTPGSFNPAQLRELTEREARANQITTKRPPPSMMQLETDPDLRVHMALDEPDLRVWMDTGGRLKKKRKVTKGRGLNKDIMALIRSMKG
jgi:hypothetical protein